MLEINGIVLDLFLVVMIGGVFALSIVVNVKVLYYYQQKEDSGFASSMLCKTIIVLSLSMAWIVNLLLPLDVRNARNQSQNFDMQWLWSAAFITLGIFLGAIIPGAMFYHELEGDDLVKNKHRKVLCNVIVTLFIIGALVLCTFPFFCKAHLPVTQYECKYDHWLAGDEPEGRKVCNRGEDSHLPIVVGFDVYVIACMTFWGWFLFVVFGGIGLASFPLDLILGFIERPQPIDEATYQQRKRIILTATQTLLGKSQELQDRDGNLSMERGFGPSRRKRILKAEYNKFKRDVVLLEDEHEKIKIAKFQRGENPVVAYVKLIVGILAAILSLAWVFHILLYICARLWTPAKKPITPMLNLLFSGLEGWLFPLGVAFFAVFVLYLLLCVVKGCLKFGMRFFFFVSIHPMKYQATPLNSILFNVEMVLLSSAPVVQFSLAAFADYARLTDAVVIFDGQIKYLTFYRWFFEHNVFIYALLLSFLLALIYLLIKPNDDGEVRFDVRTDKKLQSLAGVKKEDMQKKIGGKKKKKKGEKSPRV